MNHKRDGFINNVTVQYNIFYTDSEDSQVDNKNDINSSENNEDIENIVDEYTDNESSSEYYTDTDNDIEIESDNKIKYLIRYLDKNNYEYKQCKDINMNPYYAEEKSIFIINDNIVKYSQIKSEYIDNKPDEYYWITPNNKLYLHTQNDLNISSIAITDPKK